jgi:hypothetical protein
MEQGVIKCPTQPSPEERALKQHKLEVSPTGGDLEGAQLFYLRFHKSRQFFHISRAKIKFNTRCFVNFFDGFGIAQF